jgi:murein DD-endopeptidase MepM/ murein hydrolase activator NlpD
MAVLTSSPLSTAANNIVSLGTRSKGTLPRVQREFQDFSRFLDIRRSELEKIELPSQKKIKELSNLNIVNSFGSVGNLLSNLFSGALDIGNFISGFFPGKGEKIGKGPAQTKPQPKAQMRGGKLRLGGLRALGITNAIFSGLDFATGLAEGESVGKAGSGALGSLVGGFGGALAGSLLAGAVGQALIPVPGLGFVLGALGGAAGSFLGGYGADRAYEAVTGDTEQKQKEKLNQQEAKQKALARRVEGGDGEAFGEVLTRFSQSVDKFENFIMSGIGAMMGASYSDDEIIQEYGDYPDRDTGGFEGGELPDLEAEGGILPSGKMNSGYRTSRRPDHMGTDYAMPEGTPISVIQPGKITRAGWFDGYGYGVQVNHPGGVNSFYGHLSSINVKVGQNIDPGTVIGKVGSTGRSTGPHLHFEVDADGKSKVDPTNYADKIFRFGGNVRAKPRADSPQKMDQQASAQALTQPTQQQSQSQIKPQPQSSSETVTAPPATQRTQPQAQMLPMPQSVMVAPPNQTPNIQSYPSYSQGQSYIMERQTIISSESPNSGSQRPVVVPVGGGGNGSTAQIIQIDGSQMLNSFMKNVLLTSLSSS